MKMADENKLEELKVLMYEYSFPEKRAGDILDRIDKLMQWVVNDLIKKGMLPDELEKLAGPPAVTIGSDEDGEVSWLYPCLPDQDIVPVPDRFGWYWQLDFLNGELINFKKSKWFLNK
jgi:hypothetical protein